MHKFRGVQQKQTKQNLTNKAVVFNEGTPDPYRVFQKSEEGFVNCHNGASPGILSVKTRDTGRPVTHRSFSHSEEKGEKPVYNCLSLTPNFILHEGHFCMFSKFSEFSRKATTHYSPLLCAAPRLICHFRKTLSLKLTVLIVLASPMH